MRKLIPFAAIGYFLPLFVFAQGGLYGVILTIRDLLNAIIPVLITLATLYFIWGVIKYITAKDEEKRKEGVKIIIAGIIGLFVIVAVWGIVALLGETFGVRATPDIEGLQFSPY